MCPFIGRNKSHFVKSNFKSYNWYIFSKQNELIHNLIYNIFVQFGRLVFQQMIGIPMDTKCAPLLADLWNRQYFIETSGHISLVSLCTVYKQNFRLYWKKHQTHVFTCNCMLRGLWSHKSELFLYNSIRRPFIQLYSWRFITNNKSRRYIVCIKVSFGYGCPIDRVEWICAFYLTPSVLVSTMSWEEYHSFSFDEITISVLC